MCLTGDKPKIRHCANTVDLKKGERLELPAGYDVVVGWRAWKLTGSGTGPRALSSRHAPATWKPGEPMKTHQPIKSNLATVGVHAVLTTRDLATASLGLGDFSDKTLVVGEVVLWGDVAEHANGYRGEYGYPLRLWTNDFLATTRLRDSYGVAVEVQSARDMLALARIGR